jgi:ankyrin repeat protein
MGDLNSAIGGIPTQASGHQRCRIMAPMFQDSTRSDRVVNIGSLNMTPGSSAHVPVASGHSEPALLQLEDQHKYQWQHDVCSSNGKRISAMSPELDLPLSKRHKTDASPAGTIDNPICVDDSSGSSGQLSPYRLSDVCDGSRQTASIKDNVIIFQELEQPNDETLPLQSLPGECSSSTVPDTTTEAQETVKLDNCLRYDTSSVNTPFSLSPGIPPMKRISMTGNVDIAQPSSSHVAYGYSPIVLKTERQAEILGFVSSGGPCNLKEEGSVIETSHVASSFSELSCGISETDSGIVKSVEERSICGLSDDAVSPLTYLTSWQQRASDSESLASMSDVGGSYGSAASSGVWTSSGYSIPDDTRRLSASISLGGSLDTATRQLMEAREAVKKLAGDRTLSKLRITARSLYQVAYHGNLEKVVLLLSKGSDPNSRNSKAHGQTPMHAAAEKGCVATLMALREAGGEVNSRDANMKTPIFKSVERGHLQAVEFLIHAGVELNIKESSGMTPLHTAVKKGYVDITARLLNTGRVDIDAKDDGGWTAAVWAADLKHLRTFRCLLDHHADLHVRDEEGNICLHWGAYSGCTEVVEFILSKSSFVNAVNIHGDTPLHIAVRRGHLECARNLLVKSADLSLPNNERHTPMNLAEQGSALFKLLKTFEDLRKLKSFRKTPGPRLLSSDLSNGRESVYIPCSNEVDEEPAPEFIYVTEPQEGDCIRVERRVHSLKGCSCKDSCCSKRLCACAGLNARKRLWYDEEGHMSSDIEKLFKPLVFECNVTCKCSAECRNRVVQDRMK